MSGPDRPPVAAPEGARVDDDVAWLRECAAKARAAYSGEDEVEARKARKDAYFVCKREWEHRRMRLLPPETEAVWLDVWRAAWPLPGRDAALRREASKQVAAPREVPVRRTIEALGLDDARPGDAVVAGLAEARTDDEIVAACWGAARRLVESRGEPVAAEVCGAAPDLAERFWEIGPQAWERSSAAVVALLEYFPEIEGEIRVCGVAPQLGDVGRGPEVVWHLVTPDAQRDGGLDLLAGRLLRGGLVALRDAWVAAGCALGRSVWFPPVLLFAELALRDAPPEVVERRYEVLSEGLGYAGRAPALLGAEGLFPRHMVRGFEELRPAGGALPRPGAWMGPSDAGARRRRSLANRLVHELICKPEITQRVGEVPFRVRHEQATDWLFGSGYRRGRDWPRYLRAVDDANAMRLSVDGVAWPVVAIAPPSSDAAPTGWLTGVVSYPDGCGWDRGGRFDAERLRRVALERHGDVQWRLLWFYENGWDLAEKAGHASGRLADGERIWARGPRGRRHRLADLCPAWTERQLVETAYDGAGSGATWRHLPRASARSGRRAPSAPSSAARASSLRAAQPSAMAPASGTA